MESTTPSSAEDLLSQLPSDVLVSILDKLSLRDAIRVRVLSRQWRCLSAQLSRLALDIASFLPGDAHKFDDHDDGAEKEEDVEPAAAAVDQNAAVVVNDNPNGQEDGDVAHGPAAVHDGVHEPDAADDYYDVFSEAGDKMADVATTLLAASTRPRLPGGGGDNNNNSLDVDDAVYNTLSMRFYLRHNYMSLGRLLEDAVSSGKVRKVELTITTTFPMFVDDDDRDRESIRRSLVGYGRRFKALLDAFPAAFGAQLTQLTLEKMRHGGPDLDDILATCTRLEKLTLHNYGPEHGTHWRVRHAWLKDLNIISCFPCIIELLWLPRLEGFALDGWFWTTDRLLSLGHVPRLTAVTMTGDIINEDATLRLSRIFANNDTASLTDLRLNFSGNNVSIVFDFAHGSSVCVFPIKNLFFWL